MSDLISRQKAFSYFVTLWECIGTIMDRDEWEDVCRTTANEIPSAQPEHRFDEWCTDCKEYDQEKHCCPRFNHVIRTAIDDIIADRKKDEWIPCGERLPEEGKEVLISSDGGLYIAELEILEGNVYWNETIEYRSVKRVSAWMPLPKHYEAERKDS